MRPENLARDETDGVVNLPGPENNSSPSPNGTEHLQLRDEKSLKARSDLPEAERQTTGLVKPAAGPWSKLDKCLT
jgi:hypothetical protein